MELIKCNNLSIGYNNKILHNDINFLVEQGDYLCIIGDNGSGKTTLLKTILGLLSPLKGNIIINTKHIGYLPQQNKVINEFPASVYEIVLSGMQNQNKLFYKKEDKIRAKEIIDDFNLSNKMNTSFKELSGGEKQKTLLARAMCAAKDVLILDEPVNALDEASTKEFYDEIKKLNQNGLTIIMITHDIDHALINASKILILDNKPFFGTLSDYKEYKRSLYV